MKPLHFALESRLLILDDWGPDRLTVSQRRDLMEIVEDRYGTGSSLTHPPIVAQYLARRHRQTHDRRWLAGLYN
jgi:hypothetical protein